MVKLIQKKAVKNRPRAANTRTVNAVRTQQKNLNRVYILHDGRGKNKEEFSMPRKSTRAAQGAGSIRQRPDGRWEARVTVGIDLGTGKPDRKSVYGKTQAEVRKKMTAIQRAVDSGTYQAPDKTSVSEWLDD